MSGPGDVEHVTVRGGERVAFRRTRGRGPGVVFLPGFMSDMEGTKALALEAHCRESGRAFVRFDYTGRGRSSGVFTDGTIGRWTEDALALIDGATEGPQVLVGSSMGGWIMLLVALARPERVARLVGVAAGPDFTEDLRRELSPEALREIEERGVHHMPSIYGDEPYPITKRLLEDGRAHLVLPRAPLDVRCPVRLLQGMRDPDVPWRSALQLADALASDDVVVTLIKDGDHRLSRPEDLRLLLSALGE